MGGLTLPIFLAVCATIAAIAAYRGIGRGGSRFYQLERDTLLRRASFSLLAAIVLFISSIGLLVYQQSDMVVADEPPAEVVASVAAEVSAEPAPTEAVISAPPTLEVFSTATPDPELPTLTPTPELRNALVVGTGESGLWLRSDPTTQGDEVERLSDNSFLRVLPTAPVEADGFEWINVRTIGGQEGWVARIFVEIVDE